jgi:cobalamin biosynthesis Mg chelatase CobN
MNNKTIKNLIVSGALAILLVSSQAMAYVPGVWDPSPRVATNEPAFSPVPMTQDAPVQPQVKPVVVSNNNTQSTQSTNNTSNTTTTAKAPTQTTVARTTTRTTRVASNTNSANTMNSLPPVMAAPQFQNMQTASSFQGSNSFMPNSIVQWILVIFLILIIVLIARALRKRDPHEMHAMPAH